MQFFCRTCFLQISDTSLLAPLERESLKYQLIFCISELDLRAVTDAKLCKECIATIDIMYKFKMKCRKVENQINKRWFNVIEPSIVTQNIHLDNNIYTVCRICLKNFIDNNFHSAERLFYKKLMFCIPEMDFQVISNVNLCNNCHIILDKIYIFKMKCLNVENKIKQYLRLHDKIDFRELLAWRNVFVKYEVCSLKDYTIKQEIDFNEDEITESVKKEITNATLISPKREELKIHESVEKTSKYRNFKCNNSICDNVEHLLSNKSKDNYKHLKCDEDAVQKCTLFECDHLHTDKKPFKCLLCEYSASQKIHLQVHIRKHTGEKPFRCSLCDYCSAHASHLKTHIRTHTGERPFRCSLCKYSTADSSSLKNHIRTHTGEKPFKCPLCEYSAARKPTLREHILIHTGRKPFKCSQCSYSAVRKSTLKEHIRTHTGTKPFKCSLCKYKTGRKWCLIRHIKKHTGKKS